MTAGALASPRASPSGTSRVMASEANRQLPAVGAMVAATLLWGATFVVIRDSLHAVSPVALVIGRFAVASALLSVLAGRRWRSVSSATLGGGVLAGLCLAAGMLFQAFGLTRTSAGSSAFLTCAGTLFAAFYAWPLLGQRPTAVLLQGIALALAGAGLLSVEPAGAARLQVGVGELWTLAGSAMFGLQVVALARTAPDADPLVLSALQTLTVVAVLLPFAGAVPAEFAAVDAAGWWRFAYLVVGGSVVALLLQVIGQRLLPAGRVALLLALEPVFALAFALTLGGERFVARWWLGAALILSGVVWVEWDAARRARRDAAAGVGPESSRAR